MYCLWTRFLFGLVSILGLTSCMPETRSIPDPWRVSEPLLKQNAKSVPLTRNIAPPVQADAMIKFGDDVRDTVLSVKSECSRGNQKSHLHFESRDFRNLPVASLIPLQVLRSVSPDESNQTLSCSFEFVVTNKRNSTHRFSLQAVTIDNLAALETIQLPFKTQADGKTKTIEALNLPSIVSPLKIQFPRESKVELNCEDFQNWRTSSRPEETSELFNSLLHGSLLDESGTSVAPLDLEKVASLDIDPRKRNAVQNCRLITHYYEPGSDIAKKSLSPIYVMHFQPYSPRSQTSTPLAFETSFSKRKPTLFHIEISNPSPLTLAFRLPRDPRGSLSVQELISDQGRVIAKYPFTAKFSFDILGKARVFNSGAHTIIELKPGETAYIDLQSPAIMNSLCYLNFNRGPTPFSRARTAGFIYHFSEPFHLEQFLEWESEKPNLNGPTLNVPTIVVPVGPIKQPYSELTWIQRNEFKEPSFDLNRLELEKNADPRRTGSCANF